MCTDDVAELLVNRCIDRSRIATRGPTSVENNAVFVVDTSKIPEKDDLKCDDLGAWECKGSKKLFYSMDGDGKISKLAKDKLPDEQVSVFVIQRQWYRSLSMDSLQRIIITARESASTIPKDLIFIQYIFNNGEQPVKVNLHGNAKSTRCGAYQRTMQSTKKMIKENIGTFPARSTVHKVINERGGIMKSGSSGALPRNRTQVYNITREVNKQKEPLTRIEDPMLQVLAKAKEEQQGRDEDIFIREIPLFPEPIVFIANKQQLVDIERFCTNPEKFCVLGVDATFQIASFYFTFTTYRNLMLTTKNGNHPVCIGPGILHKQKLKTSYQTLPLLMTKYHQKAAGVLVYGTDGEKNLADAFSDVFPHAQHLCCDIHLKDNIKRKLVQCGITGRPVTEIMNDIFGNEIGDQVEGGLIHTTSAEEFDACLQSAVCKWTTLHEDGEKFVDYFLKFKVKIIRESARSDIRSMCGLGYPPTLYTQNANECMNRIIKADQDPKSSKHQTALLPYIERIRAEVARQHDEQFLAVLGLGQYRLSDKFSFLRVEENNFFRMNDSQKKALKKKFFTAPVSEPRQREEQALNGELSVLAERSGIISIPFPVLDAMFTKAATHVRDGDKTWKVPADEDNHGSSETYLVHSRHNSNPHKVVWTKKTNRVQCDKACINWSTYTLCSHCLTVAEINGILKEFLQWFKNRKRTAPNLTALINVNMPQNAGEKPTPKNRKGRANKAPSVGKTVVSHRFTPQNMVNISTHSSQQSACTQQFQPTQSTQPCTQQLQPTQSLQFTLHPTQQFQPTQFFQFTQPRTQQFQPTQSPQRTLPCTRQLQPTQPPQCTQPRTQQLQPTQSLRSTQPQIHQLQLIQPPFQQSQLHQLCQTAQPPLGSVLTAEANSNTPSRPKPPPGVFEFGRLSFLDKKVSRCYGCQELLNQEVIYHTRLKTWWLQQGCVADTTIKMANPKYHPKFHPYISTLTPIVCVLLVHNLRPSLVLSQPT